MSNFQSIPDRFDYLVVGKGLMGAAATRYLSEVSRRAGVIGPDEPANVSTHQGVFASHYDQGRITRRLSKDTVWATLAQRAIDQYRAIEAQSGIQFYFPRGGLYVALAGAAGEYLARVADIGRQLDVEYEQLTAAGLRTRFPYLRFPDNCLGVWEAPPAGYINPRELVKAQLAIATQQGATVIREMAIAVVPDRNGVTVTTREGHTYRADKVLVAAGAFSNCFDLLQRKLALRVKSETIILARVPAAEAERLQMMPTVIYQIESPVMADVYLLPAIQYPDGHFYVKMGCNTSADKTLDSFDDMCAWMTSGDSNVLAQEMAAAVQQMIPGLEALRWEAKRCLITYTPHGKPFIDEVEAGRVYVATGGNGSSAKSSDAIGRLAADLVVKGEWTADLDANWFKVYFADE
ncbi:MAG TPA: FAD-dependent oxidoreductase [Anaerolineae bacterium]